MLLSTIKISEIENFKDISPEFYKPEFIKLSKILRSLPYKKVGSIAYVTDGEHGSPMWDNNSGIKYITAEFIKPNFIEEGITKTISPIQDVRNARARVQENDVLIYSVGAYAGYAAKAEPHLFPANIPRSVAIIRLYNTDEILPEFLSVFLNSKFGAFQSQRFRAGNSQPVLALEKIKQFEIPLIDIKLQQEIADLYKESYNLRQKSISFYEEANELLIKTLGINDLNFSLQKTFTTTFENVVNSHRLDSNHFKPKFDVLVSHLKNNFQTTFLGNIAAKNRRGVQPFYVQNGEKLVVTSQYITPTHIQYESLERTSQEQFNLNTIAHIQKGDILTYTTGAYVGQTNAYLIDAPALASNHVNIIRLNTFEINPIYVAFLLNSLVGKLQTEKHIRGSAQAELYPSDISKFIIPILDKSVMDSIGQFVQNSLNDKEKAKALLIEANKKLTEILSMKYN